MQPEFNIGIIGCGKMGTDIFKYLSDFPFRLVFICKSDKAVDKNMKVFKRKLDRSLKHRLINQAQYDFRISNTILSSSLHELTDCNLVIESIPEDLNLKRELFQKLDEIVSNTCILASNSSSIQPSELIPHSRRKHNTIGLHFFYPVVYTNLVEVNTLDSTSSETIHFIKSLLNQINRFHMVFSGTSNFTINKMFLKLQAGCCFLHQQYGMSYSYIDNIVKETLFPIGIFEFMDNVGIDTILVSVKNYLKDFDDDQFYQHLFDELENLTKQGKLGKKSGEGFYSYQNTTQSELNNREATQQYITINEVEDMLVKWYLDPIYQLITRNICTKAEIEHTVKEYTNISESPFVLAQQRGYKFSD